MATYEARVATMCAAENHRDPAPGDVDARFATTHWSVVAAAGERGTEQSREALAVLCEAYWYPLYAYLRRRGQAAHDAADLTQAFFTELLEKHYVRAADPNRGRFRSFLLAALNHFAAKDRARRGAQKRGGGRRVISLDVDSAERRYDLEPVDAATPETLFNRRWALTLLDRVLDRLQAEFTVSGKAEMFDGLKVYLTADVDAVPYAQTADSLGISEGAVKVAVHRLRRRYRDLLREEIAQTVAQPDDVEAEIGDLFDALGS